MSVNRTCAHSTCIFEFLFLLSFEQSAVGMLYLNQQKSNKMFIEFISPSNQGTGTFVNGTVHLVRFGFTCIASLINHVHRCFCQWPMSCWNTSCLRTQLVYIRGWVKDAFYGLILNWQTPNFLYRMLNNFSIECWTTFYDCILEFSKGKYKFFSNTTH